MVRVNVKVNTLFNKRLKPHRLEEKLNSAEMAAILLAIQAAYDLGALTGGDCCENDLIDVRL